ncbi:MAG: hypothetical protein AUG51_00475 [Acidobacteria bacterium 13_1_20CM_3_53_8]|nr:MAG: hypothetical protein AUG51_00475 [Acidobacteria bacterium 13_1_20CM_3_53_8]
MAKAAKLRRVVGVAACAALLLAGCGGSLYKVKPVVNAPMTSATGMVQAGGIEFRAAPLLADAESQELFEANLPLAGLLPVRVEMTNETGATLPLNKVRFRLHDAEGNEWKLLSPKQSVAIILKANDVTLYNPNSRREFTERFTEHAFNIKNPMNASERRQGLLFFQTPKNAPVESPRGLVLTIEGLTQPVALRLN